MTVVKNSPSATMPSVLWLGQDGNAKRRKPRLHRLLATRLAQGIGIQVKILVFGADARIADLPVPSNHCLGRLIRQKAYENRILMNRTGFPDLTADSRALHPLRLLCDRNQTRVGREPTFSPRPEAETDRHRRDRPVPAIMLSST